jgi:hypothetical protein
MDDRGRTIEIEQSRKAERPNDESCISYVTCYLANGGGDIHRIRQQQP